MVVNKYFLLKFLIVLYACKSYSQKLFIPISDKEIISLYKKGEKSSDGSYIVNDKNNITRIKGKFDGKTPIDKWYIFFDDGNLKAHYNYTKEGIIDGIFAEYFRNGQLKTAGRFKNNKQTELWKTFYISGIIETEGEMLNGLRYKQWNYYFESGNIKEVSNYNIRGELHGDLVTFDNNGNLVSKASYRENKIDGEYSEYYYNENIALKGYYKNGLKDSTWIEYSLYGRKSFEKDIEMIYQILSGFIIILIQIQFKELRIILTVLKVVHLKSFILTVRYRSLILTLII